MAFVPMDPQPPIGAIRYTLGNECWLPVPERTPLRLCCEEWGNLGPLGLDRSIPKNKAGFRVRVTEILAPSSDAQAKCLDGVWGWLTKESH